MIRNDKEYRHASNRISELKAELRGLSSARRTAERDEVASAVIDALRMQAEDIEREMSEYEDIKEGRLLSFEADDLDSMGEIITKARIARGLTQAVLGEELGMTQQQVARYELDGWQKISLWRLAEAADALGLAFNVQACIPTTDEHTWKSCSQQPGCMRKEEHMTINELFEEGRARIAVPDDTLKEARKRRDLIRKIVEEEFATLRTFGSGSLAHGTQNDPLNDADAGVVLDRRLYEDLGPDGEGPCAIVEEVRGALRKRLKKEFPKVRFYTGGHRAIRINFMEPIEPGADDFTADLIVAIRREEGGLWIPDLDNDRWEPSDPERHTELVIERNKATGSHFARIMRLAKHANVRHGKTIFSFNVTALGLEAITEKVSLPNGLSLLLRRAADSLDKGLTEDPAGVSGPIKVNVSRRKDAAKRFKEMADLADEALDLDADGQTAQAQRNWSKVLPDAIDPPDDEDLKAELAAGLRKGNERVRQGAGGMTVSGTAGIGVPSARAYGDKDPQTR